MSMAMVTRGRLWPVGQLFIREQFVDIQTEIVDPQQMDVIVQDVTDLESDMNTATAILVEIERVETESDIQTVVDVETEIKEC